MAEQSRIEIIVDTKNSKQVLKQLETQLGLTGKASDNLNRKTRGLGDSLDGLADSGAALIAGYFSIQSARAVLKMSENYTLLEARVRRLSESNEAAAKTYESLLGVTERTGASLTDTVGLWTAITSSVNASNEDVIVFTETLQKLGTIGGSSADEMSNALRQINQAMAGGIVRSEEYSSVNEQMPEVLRAVSKELFGSTKELGMLRQMMLDGKLTSEIFFNAILKQSEDTNKEFVKMPRTITQASQSLTNNFGIAVANLDKQLGLSKNIAEFIDFLSQGIAASQGSTATIKAVEIQIQGVENRLKSLRQQLPHSKKYETHGLLGDVVEFITGTDLPEGTEAIAKAIEKEEKELARLQKARDDLAAQAGRAPQGVISGGSSTPTPFEDPGQTDVLKFEQDRLKQEIAIQDYRAKYYEDSNAKIESDLLRFQLDTLNTFGASSPEYLDAIANEQEARIQLYLDADEEILDNNKDINEAILQNQQNAQRLSEELMMNSLGLIKQSSEEGSALWYASVIGQRGMMAAQAVMSANLMASQATAAQMPLPGTDPTGALTAKAVAAGETMRIMGYANAALIAAQGVAEIAGARQAGGSVQGGSTYRANELMGYGGLPEIYSAGGNDYVTIPSGGSGTMTPVRKVDSAMGGMSVTIENYGVSKDFEVQQLTENDVKIIARDEARSEIASQSRNRSSSLNRNQGSLYKRQNRL